MQPTRSILSLARAACAAVTVGIVLSLSACGGDNAASGPANNQPKHLESALLPGLDAAKTAAAKTAQPKATLPSFTGHGWWWNPAEPGTGFAFEVQGTQAFVAFFMYDQATGAPVWYASFGAFSNNTFTGSLQSFKNGMPVAATAFRPAVLNATEGPVTIVFSSATAGRVTFPGGRVQNVEPYNFEAPVAGEPTPVRTNKPEAGWWWNQDEPGRGYAIERRGNDVFLAMFHYDAAGRADWNIINAKLDANTNSYGNALKSVIGGQSLSGAWRPASLGADAGKVDIIFNTPCEASMRLPAGNIINLRKYNFGGDDARCRADIAAAAAPALPPLAQCYTVNPGVILQKRTTPSRAQATAANRSIIDYYTTDETVVNSASTFQERPVQRVLTTTTTLGRPLSPTNPSAPVSSIGEVTPTAFLRISPVSLGATAGFAITNGSRLGARDLSLPVGGKQIWLSNATSLASSTDLFTSIRDYEFSGLETLVIAGKTLNNVCKLNYKIVSGVSFDGLRSGVGTAETVGSVWYAPGYGSIKEISITLYRDGRIPTTVGYDVATTSISP